jgi:hypothetical protein
MSICRTIGLGLFNKLVAEDIVKSYVTETGDYNLADRFDTTDFQPTFNGAQNTVDVFGCLSLPLSVLVPNTSLATILSSFNSNGIVHGHVFQTRCEGTALLVYYNAALKLIPFDDAGFLINWKRTAFLARDKMKPGRIQIWNELWQQIYGPALSYHPAIFLCMNSYKGPVPFFLQQVSHFLATALPPNSTDLIYHQIVCQPWNLKSTYAPEFIALWHLVMKETAVAYLPKKEKTVTADVSTIKFNNLPPLAIANVDKFLCLLLILFNQSYRAKLDAALAREPLSPILVSIFTRFPQLQ